MKTSDAEKNADRCPVCNGKTTRDLKKRGFVRHIERNTVDTLSKRSPKTGRCRYGLNERD
jgi:hypothetical protein